MFFRSVVGKLWATFLLLVSFVLFILSMLLIQFFESFQKEEVQTNLTQTAERIVRITNEHENTLEVLQVTSEMLGSETKFIVVENGKAVFTSDGIEETGITLEFLQKDQELSKVFTDRARVQKQLTLPKAAAGEEVPENDIVVGVPLSLDSGEGEVFFFQSLESMEEAISSTTKFIFLAAGIAIILTTIFAFFLSTRINAPLRKMKVAVTEVAQGNFDTRVPILTQDEIGDLAKSFNKMGKQIKTNLNALSQEKEHLASILSSMADGVITFDKEGLILETNPPAERFLDSWNFEMKEKSSKVPAVLMNLFDQSGQMEKEQIGEITLQGHDWVLIVSPLYGNESIRGAVAIIRDMTDERKMDKLRSDFIANVSHELRTPISMLQGYSEAIIDDIAQSQDEKKDMAKIIYDESLRMGRLVNDLLDLARMESGNMTLNYEQVQTGSYLERIAAKFSGLAREKEITLKLDMEMDDIHWEFDPDRIEQVLTNLIVNAIRHTPEGGSVQLVSRIDEREHLLIEVKDTGTGIPEEDLAFVFERFYKSDKARTRGESGTGLGLAIARNIIEAHKGTISVHSRLGEGSTFSFRLPRNMKENE